MHILAPHCKQDAKYTEEGKRPYLQSLGVSSYSAIKQKVEKKKANTEPCIGGEKIEECEKGLERSVVVDCRLKHTVVATLPIKANGVRYPLQILIHTKEIKTLFFFSFSAYCSVPIPFFFIPT